MCDSWIALPDATSSGQLIFAKNSDRPSFDCQPLVYRRRRTWPSSARVATEYASLAQIGETYAHLGCRPYWCYGYESGINEHGVVIGNEAIFTRAVRDAAELQRRNGNVPRGLLGMDAIRLALERADSAANAVRVIGELIEKHGQFGSGVPGKDHATGAYDNAYLVADATEGWVLESVGRDWAARRLTNGVASISNQPTLRTQWDASSAGLQRLAVDNGWWPAAEPLDFARAFVNERVPRQVSQPRLMRSRQLLKDRAGQITPGWMKRIARDHYEDTFLGGPYFDATDPDLHTLCMHDSPAGFTWGNTAASTIVVMPGKGGGLPVFWWTPGPPCNGCYVPFFVEAGTVPQIVTRTGTWGREETVMPPDQVAPDEFAPDSYWWLFRRLMDVTQRDRAGRPAYPERNRRVRERFDALERQFEAELEPALAEAKAAEPDRRGALLARFSESCVQRVAAALDELLTQFDA